MLNQNFLLVVVSCLLAGQIAVASDSENFDESSLNRTNTRFVLMGGYSIMKRTDESEPVQHLITDPLRPCVGMIFIGKHDVIFAHKASYNDVEAYNGECPTSLINKMTKQSGETNADILERVILYSAAYDQSAYNARYKSKHAGRSQREELAFLKEKFESHCDFLKGRVETVLRDKRDAETVVVSSTGNYFNVSFKNLIEQEYTKGLNPLGIEMQAYCAQIDAEFANVSLYNGRAHARNMFYKNSAKYYGQYPLFQGVVSLQAAAAL